MGAAWIPACGPAAEVPAWDERPPNVLLITIDTLRADHLGTYGYPRPTSPRMDAFAERGTVFENAHSSSSWTLPGLASMLTGEHASTHGCWSFASTLGLPHRTLPERLLAYGYDTASCTASVFVDPGYGLNQGIVSPRDELLRAEAINLEDTITSPPISDYAIEFLQHKQAARDAGQDPWPWFLWLHYADPHDAYLFHEGVSEPFVTDTTDELERMRDLYDGEIRFTDRHVGRVLDALDDLDLADDTIVLITSDHGEEFGDHGARNHGHTLFGELTRVPLILVGPGVRAGRSDDVVQMVDLVPTLLDLVGARGDLPGAIGPDEDLPGRSLGPVLRGDGPLSAFPALQEVRMMPHASFESVRFGEWTLIRKLDEDAPVQLFHAAEDPGETQDVASAHPDRVAELTELLETFVRSAANRADRFGGPNLRDLSADQIEALRGLGYIGRD